MTYRNNGAVGALLDEYERAMRELIDVIHPLSPGTLQKVRDPHTSHADCRSIQTVLTHVVRAGLCYEIEIRRMRGEQLDYANRHQLETAEAYSEALLGVIRSAEQLFADYPDLKLEEHDRDKKIKVAWGQVYDVEQMMEHAIVHILRHRRQIERWLLADRD
ncbi:DinB family protein [Flavilitoribacter nigricans]|uniref:DinB family protein n=1 Tax=Flavilitoribacter nigricans (strain ATCC 23147 / DSM 23189 / NBRC 102662 / NCIMB 1420 / SS-2) TaxID=1122177 RepID=A0A2D0NI79_FLAN2|nr:DinB family protein [Flavilitoribacter nigricans]PHN07879.1 hypothetical protein CRP01_03765 [Flavilitoribacter nigricans DSM 23189 = NBRC 102662]